jgi:hypothetical protein
MKFKEIGVALLITMALFMAYNVLMVRALIPGDVDGNHVVDINDISIVAANFGKQAGDTGFDSRAKLHGTGPVDIFDLMIVAIHYGMSEPA